MRGLTSHLLSLYRRSNSNIFIFRDASRAGELLVPKSGPKSALNPESAQGIMHIIERSCDVLWVWDMIVKVKIISWTFKVNCVLHSTSMLQ